MTTPSSAPRLSPALLALALRAAGVTVALSATLIGCGGTNSETPWPVEPGDVDLGPEGEVRQADQLGAPAPSGAKTEPRAKPAPAPEPEPPAATPRAPEPATPSNPSSQF